jgi:uncharacterized delta-60 repeat protein
MACAWFADNLLRAFSEVITKTFTAAGSNQFYVAGDYTFTRVNGHPTKSIARLNADGSFEPSFDAERAVTLTNTFEILALASQADGKLIAEEWVYLPPGIFQGRVHVIRLNSDGSPDPDFPRVAVVSSDAPTNAGSSWIESAYVDQQGRIYLTGGFARLGSQTQPGIARLLPDGTIDPSFQPKIVRDPNTGWPIYSVAGVQDDGKVVLTQRLFNLWRLDAAVVRLNSDGSVDQTFKPAGVLTDYLLSVALMPNNKVLLAGAIDFDDRPACFALARVNSDGSFDESFTPIQCTDEYHRYYSVKVIKTGTGVVFARQNETMLSLIALDDTGRVNSIGGPEFGRNSGSISLMSSDDGQVTIAGMFTAVNGEARASLARLKPQPDFTLPRLEILTTRGESNGSPLVLRHHTCAGSMNHPIWEIGEL